VLDAFACLEVKTVRKGCAVVPHARLEVRWKRRLETGERAQALNRHWAFPGWNELADLHAARHLGLY